MNTSMEAGASLAPPGTAVAPAATGPGGTGGPGIGLHHLAVETSDLDNCVVWYTDFFGGTVAWSLETFSDLTKGRLPGITRLTELQAAGTRFHLFTRTTEYRPPAPDMLQFQHLCLTVGSRAELDCWRERWQRLYASGRYTFARPDPATEIVVDADEVSSFYAYDVNGLEFEFAHIGSEGR